jgi:hypothetical protein
MGGITEAGAAGSPQDEATAGTSGIGGAPASGCLEERVYSIPYSGTRTEGVMGMACYLDQRSMAGTATVAVSYDAEAAVWVAQALLEPDPQLFSGESIVWATASSVYAQDPAASCLGLPSAPFDVVASFTFELDCATGEATFGADCMIVDPEYGGPECPVTAYSVQGTAIVSK